MSGSTVRAEVVVILYDEYGSEDEMRASILSRVGEAFRRAKVRIQAFEVID